MVRSDFRTTVKRYAEFVAQPWPANDADWNTVIDLGLKEYSELTLSLFADNNAVTSWLFGAPPIYDLTDGGFYAADSVGYKRCVFLPTNVVVADTVLRDLTGNPGPVSLREMNALKPYGEPGVTVGSKVKHWSFSPGRTLRLFPGPTTGFTGSGVVVGFFWHPALTNDAHEIYLPETDERAAAVYCAARGLEPRAEGSSLEKMRAMDSAAAEWFVGRTVQAKALVGELYGVPFAEAMYGKKQQEAAAE